jgi:HPt (histidine-containing phosphotransfer) domain-containing protein
MASAAIEIDTFRALQETAGADFVAELVDTFVEEAPAMLAELRQARADGDPARFRRAAHSLKSNGSTFGAAALAALARELELKGLDADPARDAEAIAALEAAYAQAAAALKELRHG